LIALVPVLRLTPSSLRLVAALCAVTLAFACTNNPYAGEDSERKILYGSFAEAPRTLDPAVAYTTSSHVITGAVYDTLLEYHYLKRPYTLIPGLARALPEVTELPDGRVLYQFELREGVLFQDDPAFELGGPGRRTREVLAADVAFELMRIADPAVNSPVVEPFSHVSGFAEFSERLVSRRKEDPAFAELPVHEQYAAVGGITGARADGKYGLDVLLAKPYPQILYWFAMQFTTPMAWEAVQYYDGEEGRLRLGDHPVGTGAYVLEEYDKQSIMVLQANPNWYGAQHPEWKAPGAVYPSEGEPGDAEAGRLDPRYVGRSLPFIERVEFRREKESIPRFNKFLQGYYDSAGVIMESFDKVIDEGGLSDEMEALGIGLEKNVNPSVFYISFNLDDEILGLSAGESSRKLRQAMSLVIDSEEYSRLFNNGRGVSAQTPLPPGLFGYDPDYVNPYRQMDLERARALMREAGFPDGIDPKTDKPLKLTFDTPDTSAQGRLRYEFFTGAWRQLGIDVKIEATNYNQFQEKVRNGSYQVFMWGWIADYPDPENFLFLLWGEMARSKNNGPNTANFMNARYDELYLSMKARENGPERMAEIEEMRLILEHERPWIELFHSEDYALYHGWLENVKAFGMSFPTTKYRDLDVERRTALRESWNQPVMWPLYVLVVLAVVVLVPGIVTFMRERQ
jgi:oligopeptide transport system substrate-binding protein